MERIAELMDHACHAPGPLGTYGQRPRRRQEQSVRRQAVAFRRWAGSTGLSLGQAASKLGVAPHTLTRWQRCRRRQDASSRRPSRGRPRRRASSQERQRVLGLMEQLGPTTGLPRLQAACPGITRSQIAEFQRVHRDRWDHQHPLCTLRWTTPGAVWAWDFTDPPTPIDGCYRHLLVARDLASSYQLLAQPASEATARVAADALEFLLRSCGPPLVLKSDNGGCFTAPPVRDLLAAWGIVPLTSPPYCPQYNGGVEAGNGSVKLRTYYLAAACGRPGSWSCDDVEAGRTQANATLRPWGRGGPTPGQAWADRPPITAKERRAFQDSVRRLQEDIRVARGYAPDHALGGAKRAALARAAVRRALEQRGYLQVQRRRITPPIP
jgi:transposase InsO family protein